MEPTASAVINEETAATIIEKHFKVRPKKVKKLTGGLANFVYEASVDSKELKDKEFIIRLSDVPQKINYYQKEQWAVARARERGIPIPDILEVGNEAVPFPYMISEKVKVDGRPALEHPKRSKIIHNMGKYASIINTIPTTGFGHVFDWSNNTLSKNKTWKEYMEKELEIDKRLEIFERGKIFEPEQMKKLKRIIRGMTKWDKSPTLNHCDMRLKNMMVDYDGNIIAVLDWENCLSNAAPYWEVSIALHDLGIDGKQEFLNGYGLREKDYMDIAPELKAINLINYAQTIENMIERKDEKKLQEYRVRLNGGLDLYSL